MTTAAPAAYNLAPTLWLLLFGALLALAPLAWVWRRQRGSTALARTQALTLLTLFLTFDLVLFGAFTRLTDSGLGCPDWPGCYGHSSPVGAQAHIAQAQEAMPTGPVTHGKAWVEMLHRYLATAVGGLILVLTVMAWWPWLTFLVLTLVAWFKALTSAWRNGIEEVARPGGGKFSSPWWPTFTLVWVCLQGAFGALTVTMKLFPAIVTLHLLGAMGMLVLLATQVARLHVAGGGQPVAVRPGLRGLLWLAVAMLLVQISLGAWVSTNYAVLACTDFPTCQGVWWPSMNFPEAFQLWRPLGQRADGGLLSFAALTAIHYTHRAMAGVVLLLLAAAAWRLNREPALRAHSRGLAALLGLQLATGLGNVVLGWPLLAALAHTGGAAALLLVLTWALCATRSAGQPQAASGRTIRLESA